MRAEVTRRVAILATTACLYSGSAPASIASSPTSINLPLQPSGGGVLTTGIFIDGEPFRLIIDTGSPYLIVPQELDCDAQPPKLSAYGCAAVGQFRASGKPPTTEQYGTKPGRVAWLKGDLEFGESEMLGEREADGQFMMRVRFVDAGRLGGSVVFGAADRVVMGQSVGALLGLIRNTNSNPALSTIPVNDLRPTALEQFNLCSFRLNAPKLLLTLSTAPLIKPTDDALQLLDPRLYGDGVEHICCRVDGDEIVLDGRRYASKRPVFCVFDSGLTGCVLSKSLVDELGLGGNVNGARVTTSTPSASAAASATGLGGGGEREVRSLSCALRTESGKRITLGSSITSSPKLFYVQTVALNWFVDRENGPHVVALGQCVLGKGTLTVDGPQRRAVWAAA